MVTAVEEVIVFCANDEQCPLPSLVGELSERFNTSLEEAAEMFRSAADFIVYDDRLVIEMSEKFWEDVRKVDKKQFFQTVSNAHLIEKDLSPFYYISYVPQEDNME